jgi:hypothetical protein
MAKSFASGNGEEVREQEMRRLRCEIRDRSRQGHSHDQIVQWLASQEDRVTECELTLAKMLARHHAARAGSGVTVYLDDLGRTDG